MAQKTATLITYDLSSGSMSKSQASLFHKRLYGYTDSSHGGKYTYKRKGLLSEMPHLNPSRSVIIIPRDKAGEVLTFLGEHGATVFAIDVVLNEAQKKALQQIQ
ncbi:MAG: hypothetical protein ABH829_00700 [archaeon]